MGADGVAARLSEPVLWLVAFRDRSEGRRARRYEVCDASGEVLLTARSSDWGREVRPWSCTTGESVWNPNRRSPVTDDVLTEDPELERLRYPIGRFVARPGLSADEVKALIDEIAALPARLRSRVAHLSPEQLDTPYRPGGWTVRQVVHHLPDSHLNSYVRFKLALTEDEPAIKAYDEAAWAELPDARTGDVEVSLALLEAVHRRWVLCLRALESGQLRRSYRHPELGLVTLAANLQLYAWHGRHHLAQITSSGSGWGS